MRADHPIPPRADDDPASPPAAPLRSHPYKLIIGCFITFAGPTILGLLAAIFLAISTGTLPELRLNPGSSLSSLNISISHSKLVTIEYTRMKLLLSFDGQLTLVSTFTQALSYVTSVRARAQSTLSIVTDLGVNGGEVTMEVAAKAKRTLRLGPWWVAVFDMDISCTGSTFTAPTGGKGSGDWMILGGTLRCSLDNIPQPCPCSTFNFGIGTKASDQPALQNLIIGCFITFAGPTIVGLLTAIFLAISTGTLPELRLNPGSSLSSLNISISHSKLVTIEYTRMKLLLSFDGQLALVSTFTQAPGCMTSVRARAQLMLSIVTDLGVNGGEVTMEVAAKAKRTLRLGPWWVAAFDMDISCTGSTFTAPTGGRGSGNWMILGGTLSCSLDIIPQPCITNFSEPSPPGCGGDEWSSRAGQERYGGHCTPIRAASFLTLHRILRPRCRRPASAWPVCLSVWLALLIALMILNDVCFSRSLVLSFYFSDSGDRGFYAFGHHLEVSSLACYFAKYFIC
ncbi:hypothetical protein NL676_028984 [Syzygium grande]|nr:hypothetical protein NL676_028984 [Syzygium grande]